MSIQFSTYEFTSKITNRNTIVDAGFAAVQGAFLAGLGNKFNVLSLTNIGSGAFSNMGAGAVVGASLRLAHKVSEIVLNSIADIITPIDDREDGLACPALEFPKTITAIAVARKIADIALTAGIVSFALTALSAALPAIVPAISMKFTTYLLFSALENFRPIKFGRTKVENLVENITRGPQATIEREYGLVRLTYKVWQTFYPTEYFEPIQLGFK